MGMEVLNYIDADKGLIWGEIFHSPEIYEQELKEVFGRSWIFLAHDSMLKKAGDFIQTYIGEDPVVVTRQGDGSVKVWLNQCRHRGMRICRADRGNAKAFMCSYHGWTYDTAGNLIHVPHEELAYDASVFEKQNHGARQIGKIESYKGFIFGTWDPEAPSLAEYLGDMAWIFDAYIDRWDGGLEVVGIHKWVIPANWKFNAEQPANDMYHTEATHASAMQVLGETVKAQRSVLGDDEGGRTDGGVVLGSVAESYATGQIEGRQFSSPYGHGSGWFAQPPGVMLRSADTPVVTAWEAQMRDHTIERIGELRTDSVRGHANIFPNFMFLQNGTMRVTHPRGPSEMEIWSWTFVPTIAPAEVKEALRLNVLRTFSAAGMLEQDDAENWLEEQRIMRGYMARQEPLIYTMQLGNAEMDADGIPGKTAPHVFADEGARGMYRHWADLMSGASWAEIAELHASRAATDGAAPAAEAQ